MSTPTIRRVSHSEILGAVNAPELIAEYAAACSVPDAEPQHSQYAALEQAGALQCFGAYVDGALVGFASVLTAVMPHHGKRVATVESIFVAGRHRSSNAGTYLLSATEQYAAETDCVAMLYTARIGSPLETVLLHRYNCAPTHTTYTRWL
jgi:GNAT superfamily N-acetyltransferase